MTDPTLPLRHAVTRPHRRTAAPLLLALLAFLLAGCTATVRVEWSTETEMNTAGFNLFRGESPDGPFPVRVNEQLIPPAADPLTGGQYSYLDRTAQAGQVYYYQLQEVERNGGTNTFGPIRVRAGGLEPRYVLVLIPLALGVLALWLFGGKRATRPPDSDARP